MFTPPPTIIHTHPPKFTFLETKLEATYRNRTLYPPVTIVLYRRTSYPGHDELPDVICVDVKHRDAVLLPFAWNIIELNEVRLQPVSKNVELSDV